MSVEGSGPAVHALSLTLARRLSRAVALGDDVIVAAKDGGALPGGAAFDAIHAIATVARRLRARSIDATLTPDALFVAMTVARDVELPTHPGRAERAARAAFGVPLVLSLNDFVKIPGADADAPILAAAARLGCSYLARIRAYEHDAIIDLDPESVHQLRIGVRRLRAVMRLLAEQHPSAGVDAVVGMVRKLGSAAGLVRDHDVVIDLVRALRAEPHARAAAVTLLEERRAVAQRRLARMLESADYSASMHRAHSILSALEERNAAGDTRTIATARVRRERRRLSRRLRRDLATPGAYHEVRRAVRRVRDTIEVFGDAVERGEAKWRKRLSALQTLLGRLNDLDTAQTLLGHASDRIDPVRDAIRAERALVLAELAVPLALLAQRLDER